jgi:unsaturated rhamnogalacturonyl hydrolase
MKNRERFGSEARYGWGRTPDFHALDDCGSMGAAMIKTYLKDKNDDYLELINITADYISNRQFRLDDGTLARHRPQYHSIWVDDLYMSVPSSRRNCSAYCLKIMRAGTRFSTYIVQ